MYQAPESPVITRHFVNFSGRQVHFRLAGSGPALLLLHQSPASSAEMATELESFADDFTVVAPDTPGFGLSDPLDERTLVSPDLTPFAEALGEFLSALGIEKTLIYGFHTGAMLGFEFARLYPERCAAVIVNGLVVCEPAELADLLRNYNVMPALTPEGTHLPWMWARMRDQTLFFPWYRKEPGARMGFDVPDPVLTHTRLIDFLRAEEGGRSGYQAAFSYPTPERIGDVKAAVYLLNYRQDPLAPHPERLAEIPNGMPREIFANPTDLNVRVDEILSRHASQAVSIRHLSLPVATGESSGEFSGGLRREIVNTGVGPVFVRYSIPVSDDVLLWLHDAGSSSQSLVSLARRFAGSRQVVLVDLPGHGDTGVLHLADYSAERLAKLAVEVLGGLGIETVSIVAHGAAGAIAAAMAKSDPQGQVVRKLVLIDPWAFDSRLSDPSSTDPAKGERMAADFAPALQPQAFGEHLLTAWYFARDSELFCPWNAPLANNALSRMPEISPAQTQARVVDLIKAGPEFRRLVRDLLAYDLAGSLASIGSVDGSVDGSRIRIAARRGNGYQDCAETAAERVGAGYAVLPERLDDWAPELEKCLN
jgi:pimeloyl-ACP methyl ester carboxylesterase